MPKYFEDEPEAVVELSVAEDIVNLDNISNTVVLTDTSRMPFGKKFRGVPMQDVDVNYLHWIWTKTIGNGGSLGQVKDYILRSLDALKMENKDLIWGKRR